LNSLDSERRRTDVREVIDVFETTAGQVTDVLKRLGVSKERMITVMIEPDDWLTKARQESRRLVIKPGLAMTISIGSSSRRRADRLKTTS
jgi:hypothetical protein